MFINSILIDFDGVLRHWPSNNSAIEEKHRLPEGVIVQYAFSPQFLLPAIRGQSSDNEWREVVALALAEAYPESAAAHAVAEWSQSVGSIDFELLDRLRSYTAPGLALVTNATSRLDSDLEAHGLETAFDHVFNSSEFGFVKPEKEFFTYILDVLSIDPQRLLFIDDIEENIEAAGRAGLNTHLFVGVEQLNQCLSSMTFS